MRLPSSRVLRFDLPTGCLRRNCRRSGGSHATPNPHGPWPQEVSVSLSLLPLYVVHFSVPDPFSTRQLHLGAPPSVAGAIFALIESKERYSRKPLDREREPKARFLQSLRRMDEERIGTRTRSWFRLSIRLRSPSIVNK